MASKTSAKAATRRRRLDGWGFVGEGLEPSAPMLAWLRERLGDTEPFAALDPTDLHLAEPLDLPDLGAPGYEDQTIVNGYREPEPLAFTEADGRRSIRNLVSACAGLPLNSTICPTLPDFDVSVQALVVDPTQHEEHRDRGVLLARLERPIEGLGALSRYRKLVPEAEDGPKLDSIMDDLRLRVGMDN